jgi:hypothetical protein
MSEFSDSYHLRTDDTAKGRALLRRAGLEGYVHPAAQGWVSICPEGMPFEPNMQLIHANTGVLVHYVFGEHHAWGCEIYQGPELITRHEVSWDPELAVLHTLSPSAFDAVAQTALAQLPQADLQRLLRPTTLEDIHTFKPASVFAQAIGLPHYAWRAFDYLWREQELGQPLPDGAQLVSKLIKIHAALT